MLEVRQLALKEEDEDYCTRSMTFDRKPFKRYHRLVTNCHPIVTN